MTRVLAALMLLIVVAGCGRSVIIDKPDSASFQGKAYLGVDPTAVQIPDASTTKIGTASEVYGRVADPTVYALDGVDPTSVIALRMPDGRLMVFLAEGTDGKTLMSFAEIPGMCVYAADDPGC